MTMTINSQRRSSLPFVGTGTAVGMDDTAALGAVEAVAVWHAATGLLTARSASDLATTGTVLGADITRYDVSKARFTAPSSGPETLRPPG